MKADHETLEHIGDATAALALTVGRMTELVEAVRGLALNSVLATKVDRYDSAGVVECSSSVPWASVVVLNHGTMAITVQAGGRQDKPSPVGAAQFVVPAGGWACMPLAGTALSIYGRPDELVGFSLYSQPQPPAAGFLGSAPWFTVTLPAASGTLYTPPHGRRPILGGYMLRNTGAATTVLRVRDGGPTGQVLLELDVDPGYWNDYIFDGPGGIACANTSLYLEYTAGAGNTVGAIYLR